MSKENIKLKSKQLVEKLMNYDLNNFDKVDYYMFSISKFIFLKEKIIKRDFKTNTIYFNNIDNYQYITNIKKLTKKINIKNITLNDEELSKIRNSLMHFNFNIFDSKIILYDSEGEDDIFKCETDFITLYNFFCQLETTNEFSLKEYFDEIQSVFESESETLKIFEKSVYSLFDKMSVQQEDEASLN